MRIRRLGAFQTEAVDDAVFASLRDVVAATCNLACTDIPNVVDSDKHDRTNSRITHCFPIVQRSDNFSAQLDAGSFI